MRRALACLLGVLGGGASLGETDHYQAVWQSLPSGMQRVLFIDVGGLLGTIREGLDPSDRAGLDSTLTALLKPVEFIAMANDMSRSSAQLSRLVLFISGGNQ